MGDISKNFSMSEFERSEKAEELGIDNSVPPYLRGAIEHLCTAILQPIRDHFNRAMRISSGYRSPELNARLTGASATSQHQKGEAADFSIDGFELDEIMTWIVSESGLPYDQVIREPSWIHISSLPPNRYQALLKEKGRPYVDWKGSDLVG